MKIKHWQGYGTVNAKKISMTKENNITKLHILVSGDHEYGLARNDKYDVGNWLIKKFDKTFTDSRNIVSMTLEEGYDDSTKTETCDYYIEYRS